MTTGANRCLRCNGEMEGGFVLDYGLDRKNPATWVEGSPEAGLLGTTTRGKRQRRISTFRCRQCGWLDSFADPAEAPEEIACLECGSPLPPGKSVCASCGWTWKPQ
jgi:Domain of unknown function (DUF6487)